MAAHIIDPLQVHVLLADLHRQMLLRFSLAAGTHFQGLSAGANALKLTNRWKRRSREIDAAFGIARKISPHSVTRFLRELDAELEKTRRPDDSQQHGNDQQPEGGNQDDVSIPGGAGNVVTMGSEMNADDSVAGDAVVGPAPAPVAPS